MHIRFGQLLKVPLFCIGISYLGSYLYESILSELGIQIVASPNGMFLTSIFSVVLFAATLFFGNFLFRDMLRIEVLVSASALIIIYLTLETIQLYYPNFSSFAIGIYTAPANEWCNIVVQLLNWVTNNIVASGFISCFSPLLFVLMKNE